jgi:hypothetical protein
MFNFKLPRLKILDIELFYLYPQTACHYFRQTLNINALQLPLDLGLAHIQYLLNLSLIPIVHSNKMSYDTTNREITLTLNQLGKRIWN